MKRMLIVLVLLSAAAAMPAAAGKKNPEVEKAVKQELMKKAFYTKILVGSYINCPDNENQQNQPNAIKAIDTELSPNSAVRYLARAGCFYPASQGGMGVIFNTTRFYVQRELASQLNPGQMVWVLSVDFKDDRVEVAVSSTNNARRAEGSGKIKYMLGAGYREMTTEQLMEAIAMGLKIPAYDKLIDLRNEYSSLAQELNEAEARFNADGQNTVGRLQSARALRSVLERMVKNRAEYQATGHSDSASASYTEKLNALTPQIATLTEEARKEHVKDLHARLAAQQGELQVVQLEARKRAPTTMVEWAERANAFIKYARIVVERKKLLDYLLAAKEKPSPEDVKALEECNAEVEGGQRALEAIKKQIQLGDVNAYYAVLKKKSANLSNSYTLAFGTAKERSTLREFAIVLSQLVANRARALELGDPAAEAQLAKCKAEAERYLRKLKPSDPSTALGGVEISGEAPESPSPKAASPRR